MQKYQPLSYLLYIRYCHTFFYKKTIFLPEPQFSLNNARNQAEIFLIFFLTFFYVFIICNTNNSISNKMRSNNNKSLFLTYIQHIFSHMCPTSQLLMALPLIIKTEKNLKYEKSQNILDFVTFKESRKKLAFLKIAAKVEIFLTFC